MRALRHSFFGKCIGKSAHGTFCTTVRNFPGFSVLGESNSTLLPNAELSDETWGSLS